MTRISAKLQKDVIINVAFAGVNLIGALVLTRISTALFVPAAFGLFMLVRRYSSAISTFAELGASVAQFRFMGLLAHEKYMKELVSMSVVLFYIAVSAILLVATFFGEPWLAHLALPNNANASWVLWYSMGLSVQNLLLINTFNNLLQERRVVIYNIARVMNAFGIFLVIFMFSRHLSVRTVLLLYLILGDCMVAVGVFYFNLLPLRLWREMPWNRFGALARDVYGYGVMRGFVAFLSGALFLIAPWLIRSDLQEVGYISTIYLFLQMTAVIILPVNQLSMVISARYMGQNQEDQIALGVRMLFGLVVIFSVIFTVGVYPWMDGLIRIVVSGQQIEQGVRQYSILLICVIPLSIFNGLRGIIEMRWKRPVNLFNLFLSHALGIVGYLIARQFYGMTSAIIIYSIVVFWALGILTTISSRSLLQSTHWLDMGIFIILACVVLFGTLWLREHVLRQNLPVLVQLVGIAITMSALPLIWWFVFKPVLLREILDYIGWSQLLAKRLGRVGRLFSAEG